MEQMDQSGEKNQGEKNIEPKGEGEEKPMDVEEAQQVEVKQEITQGQ